MKKCFINVLDEVWCTIAGILPSEHKTLSDELAPHVEGYFFQPKYKLGVWDGRIRFYNLKTGKTYIRLLDKILPRLEAWGYDIELTDRREPLEHPEIPGQITAVDEDGLAVDAEGLDMFGDAEYAPGKQFKLRPYQLQCVQEAVRAGSGFIIAGTGSGKCLAYETRVKLKVTQALADLIVQLRSNTP